MENFNIDFGKPDNQDKYHRLPESDKGLIVGSAQDEADKIKGLVQAGGAKDYAEANNIIDKENSVDNDEVEVPSLESLMSLDVIRRKEVVDNLIEEFYLERKKHINKAEKIQEETAIKNDSKGFDNPKLFKETMHSIYDEEEAKKLSRDIKFRSGAHDLIDDIFEEKPDVVFLLPRSAVPAGFVYKAYVEELGKVVSQQENASLTDRYRRLPRPKFMLTNHGIPRWKEQGLENGLAKAIKEYEHKLEHLRPLFQQKNAPLAIKVFDESESSGLGLKLQVEALSKACVNINLPAKVSAFGYPSGSGGTPPEIPLPISGMAKSKDNYRKSSVQFVDIYGEEPELYVVTGQDHPKWRRIYEQQATKLTKMAGKSILDSQLNAERSNWVDREGQRHITKFTPEEALSDIFEGAGIK